ncbi:SMP-30/gluconolactonase/LRE family protein [Kitasatospora sp. NPDC096147]|uniref:SMP-30/gluconolactonase/LRE family protein n=1 Tax=Kitasatospora sp. NPDC096147 TaxID=3364093 RepID=UPI0037F63C29
MRAEPADSHRLTLGEGPRWDAGAQRLYWLGIPDQEIRWLDPATGHTDGLRLDVTPGCLAPAGPDRLLLATERGFETLELGSGIPELNTPVEADQPDRRMNDGAVDPFGRIVAGTMRRAVPHTDGRLYRRESDGSVRQLLDGLAIPNGLGWPEPDRFWHVDSPAKRATLYEYPEQGPLGPQVRVLDLAEYPGEPDGLALDPEGNLWVAFWGGSAVHCFSPTGTRLATVEVPVPRATACAFDDAGTLWITTAVTADHPDSGRLFRAAGVR